MIAIPIEPVEKTEQQDFLEDMGLKLHHRSMGNTDYAPLLAGLDKSS